MEEFTYEQIRVKALKQGVKDNKVHIGLWANLNNYLKTRRYLVFTNNVQSATNEYEDTSKIPAKQDK